MLTKKTKYGLKALVFMARREETDPISIGLIAESENISIKFLENILLSLRKAGFLGSQRGKNGGYYLMKKPSEIRMVDVIRILEGPIAMVPCVSLNFYEKCEDCENEELCSINRLFLKVRDNTLEVLRNNTLEELARLK